MKKKISLFLILIPLFLILGCTTLKNLGAEIAGVHESKEAETIISEPVANIVLPFIPQPYQAPALIVLGYALALVRRLYKKNRGSVK